MIETVAGLERSSFSVPDLANTGEDGQEGRLRLSELASLDLMGSRLDFRGGNWPWTPGIGPASSSRGDMISFSPGAPLSSVNWSIMLWISDWSSLSARPSMSLPRLSITLGVLSASSASFSAAFSSISPSELGMRDGGREACGVLGVGSR